MRTRTIAARRALPRRQSGITLITALIMLVLLTLMAITAFQMGASQTVIVSNAQHREEAMDAAQQTIDKVLNSANFMVSPVASIPAGNCAGGAANTWCVDVNGDGVSDIKVALSPLPKCLSGAPIANSTLDFSKTEDVACSIQTNQTFGVEGSTSQNSLCASSGWEITAAASDLVTNTTVTVVQGASARIATTDLSNNCK